MHCPVLEFYLKRLCCFSLGYNVLTLLIVWYSRPCVSCTALYKILFISLTWWLVECRGSGPGLSCFQSPVAVCLTNTSLNNNRRRTGIILD